ncbi:DUF58 domain-containing protein [Halomicrobium salinisoli]|uniref:DUF58 domain-containing protein n=1 Tax=Halomicrobium salinisoli TaxID=2878391 RepID=UPI001CF02A40|nr:DUF58 domain-containing protein [Halomicrobium salinisoli]
MRPTRRGYAALAVVALALANAWLSGPRALNAVAAPLLVAVAAGAVQVYRAGEPDVERSEPRHGFPGESRTVELRVDGGGVAAIEDRVGEGLSGGVRAERSLPATVSYEVTYERRGLHRIGPATVGVRDVLGLVETEYEIYERDEALVYPQVHSLAEVGVFRRTLGPESDERTEFDRLREYVPGDSLRDVAWKASAKNDDLLVTEYTDPADEEAISVAARSDDDRADEMATATATLVVGAVRAGLAFELILPDGELARGFGETHRQYALELLAQTTGGDVPEDAWNEADVRVHADADGTRVTVGERERDLADLTATRDNPLVAEVEA